MKCIYCKTKPNNTTTKKGLYVCSCYQLQKIGNEYIQYLKERKEKDEYKKNFAIKNGYYYLEIPYWCDDDEETWKKMIDEKINKINEGTTTETYQLNP